MTKNDFRVTSIFKVIIRICMKNVEFWGKTSKFLPKRFSSFPVFSLFFVFLFFSNSKTPEILSLVTLVTNYHKLWSDPDENVNN